MLIFNKDPLNITFTLQQLIVGEPRFVDFQKCHHSLKYANIPSLYLKRFTPHYASTALIETHVVKHWYFLSNTQTVYADSVIHNVYDAAFSQNLNNISHFACP